MIRTIKQITKKIIISITVLFILFSSLCQSFAFEVVKMDGAWANLTQERAGNYVANFAINFISNYGKKVVYDKTNATEYGGLPNGEKKYEINNVSWIYFVYNESLGIKNIESLNSYTDYVAPHTRDSEATYNENIFEKVEFSGDVLNISELASKDEIKPGDILVKSKFHEPSEEEKELKQQNGEEIETIDDYKGCIYLYIGAGQVIYCIDSEAEELEQQAEQNKSKTKKEVLVQNYIDNINCTIDQVYRIKKNVAESISDQYVTMIFAGKGYDPQITYQGIPSRGAYLGTTTLLDKIIWLIECIPDVLDYLIGILTYAVRAILIGWVNIVENLVNYTILGSKEKVDGTYVNSITGKSNNLGIRISIEDIIYNKVPIFDVNFFNVDIAGGCEIAPDSIVALIRQNIAKWYYLIRMISITLMVIILIYVGLRIALSSIGGKKAQYKSALVGWLVGFIAIVSIHLFMYVLFTMNEYLVGLFEKIALSMNGGELSLYETIRTKSYAPRFTEGFGATIIYAYLVFVLVKFAIMYFKRYLTVTILGLVGPIVGLKYAIERATGRKTKSIAGWMFEFAMNVLIQAMHAILYILLMNLALSIAFESLAGYVVALVILNFMLKADKLFMKIFSFDRSKSVGDTVEQEGFLQQFAKFSIGYSVTKKAVKGIFGLGVATGRRAINLAETTGDIYYDREEGETQKIYQRNLYKAGGMAGRFLAGESGLKPFRKINRNLGGRISSVAALSLLQGTKASKEMDAAAINALKVNMKLKQKMYKRTVKSVKDSIGSGFKFASAMPLIVADPMTAAGLVYSGASNIKHGTDRTAIKNNEIAKRYEKDIFNDREPSKKSAISNAIHTSARLSATGRMMEVAKTAQFDINRYEEEKMKNHVLIEQFKKASGIEKDIKELYSELEDEMYRLNPGESSEKIQKMAKKEFMEVTREAKKKRVSNSTIKNSVEEYMLQHGIWQLSEYDAEEIMKIIKRKESEAGKILEFEDDAMENIKDALRTTIDERSSRKKITETHKAEMQSAFKKGLAKQGSIKSEKVDTTAGTVKEQIKAEIQEKSRSYMNLYEGTKKKIDSLSAVESKILMKEDN